MPIVQVSAPMLLSYKGVDVFHAYRHADDAVDEPMTYHYSLSPRGELDFDVRELPAYHQDTRLSHEFIIKAAIDAKALVAPKQESNAESMTLSVYFDNQEWKPFDYNAPELGLYYVRFCQPVWDVEQTDQEQLNGEQTGEMQYGVALVFIEENNGFPEFVPFDRTLLGEVCETATVTHCAEAKLPRV